MESYDLLPHRYRPDCTGEFSCHLKQARQLRNWIQEFINNPEGVNSDEDSSESDDSSILPPKCALLTGPPGVGKTSLVYTVANELKLHVVESNASEKRDCRLFSSLKLTNQKGKINTITKLFQAAQQKQQQKQTKKRRKLSETPLAPQPRSLSLSGDTSIVLFDDVDVVFKEDGPFLKSLVEFIWESKRPVVLTATQSTDRIKDALQRYEFINLNKPLVEDCSKLLADICKRENYRKLSKSSRCQTIANYFECDIRQCLNRIHFYQDQADRLDNNSLAPEFLKLNLEKDSKISNNKAILDCYESCSLIDIMDSRFNLINRNTSLNYWLDGKPSCRNEESSFDYDLGEQIRESIVELTRDLHSDQLMRSKDLLERSETFNRTRNEFLDLSHRMNTKIQSRIEPPEREFFIDYIPLLKEITRIQADRKTSNPYRSQRLSLRGVLAGL